MVKGECSDQFKKRLGIRDDFDGLLSEVQTLAPEYPKLLSNVIQARKQIIANIRDKGHISTEEADQYMARMERILTLSQQDELSSVKGVVDSAKETVIKDAIIALSECECGPGQELKEVQLKVPIMISDTVETALKESGYDVGTDAYYEDPNKFVSVIVRPTKELKLRSGG